MKKSPFDDLENNSFDNDIETTQEPLIDEAALEEAFEEADMAPSADAEAVTPEDYERLRRRTRRHLLFWLLAIGLVFIFLAIFLSTYLVKKNQTPPLANSDLKIELNKDAKEYYSIANHPYSKFEALFFMPSEIKDYQASELSNLLSYEKDGFKYKVRLTNDKGKIVKKIDVLKIATDQLSAFGSYKVLVEKKSLTNDKLQKKEEAYNYMDLVVDFRKILMIHDENSDFYRGIKKKDLLEKVKGHKSVQAAIADELGFSPEQEEYITYTNFYDNFERYKIITNKNDFLSEKKETFVYATNEIPVLSYATETAPVYKVVFKVEKNYGKKDYRDDLFIWTDNYLNISHEAIDEIASLVPKPSDNYDVKREWKISKKLVGEKTVLLETGTFLNLTLEDAELIDQKVVIGTGENKKEFNYHQVEIYPQIYKKLAKITFLQELGSSFEGNQIKTIEYQVSDGYNVNGFDYDLIDPTDQDVLLPDGAKGKIVESSDNEKYFLAWRDAANNYYYHDQVNKNPILDDIELEPVIKEYEKIAVSIPHPKYSNVDIATTNTNEINFVLPKLKESDSLLEKLDEWKFGDSFKRINLIEGLKDLELSHLLGFYLYEDKDKPIQTQETIRSYKDRIYDETDPTRNKVFAKFDHAYYKVTIQDVADGVPVTRVKGGEYFYSRLYKNTQNTEYATPDISFIKPLTPDYELEKNTILPEMKEDGTLEFEIRFNTRILPVVVYKHYQGLKEFYDPKKETKMLEKLVNITVDDNFVPNDTFREAFKEDKKVVFYKDETLTAALNSEDKVAYSKGIVQKVTELGGEEAVVLHVKYVPKKTEISVAVEITDKLTNKNYIPYNDFGAGTNVKKFSVYMSDQEQTFDMDTLTDGPNLDNFQFVEKDSNLKFTINKKTPNASITLRYTRPINKYLIVEDKGNIYRFPTYYEGTIKDVLSEPGKKNIKDLCSDNAKEAFIGYSTDENPSKVQATDLEKLEFESDLKYKSNYRLYQPGVKIYLIKTDVKTNKPINPSTLTLTDDDVYLALSERDLGIPKYQKAQLRAGDVFKLDGYMDAAGSYVDGVKILKQQVPLGYKINSDEADSWQANLVKDEVATIYINLYRNKLTFVYWAYDQVGTFKDSQTAYTGAELVAHKVESPQDQIAINAPVNKSFVEWTINEYSSNNIVAGGQTFIVQPGEEGQTYNLFPNFADDFGYVNVYFVIADVTNNFDPSVIDPLTINQTSVGDHNGTLVSVLNPERVIIDHQYSYNYRKMEGYGTKYEIQDTKLPKPVTITQKNETKNLVYYFTRKSYYISFFDYGTDQLIQIDNHEYQQRFIYGEDLKNKVEVPDKDLYVKGQAVGFKNYYQLEEGNKVIFNFSPDYFNDGQKTMIAQNWNIYYEYEKKELVDVTFENLLDTDTNRPSNFKIEPGKKITQIITSPQRTGFSFCGWFEDEKMTQTFSFDSIIYSDTKIYAKFIAETDALEFFTTADVGTDKIAITSVKKLEGILTDKGILPIPYQIKGRKVISFGFNNPTLLANQGDQISVISLPDGITEFTANAFKGLSELKNIENFPKNIKVLPISVFENTPRLFMNLELLSVTNIGDRAFYNANRMGTLEFGKALISVGQSAFANSSINVVIKEENLNDNLNYNNSAFQNNTGTEVIRIAKNATKIPSYFAQGSNVRYVYSYSVNTISIGSYAFNKAEKLEIFQALNNFRVERFAFAETIGLRNVGFDKIIYYGSNCFQDSQFTEDVIINSSVTSIGDFAFIRNKAVTKMVFHKDFSYFGSNTLREMHALRELHILYSGQLGSDGNEFTEFFGLTLLNMPYVTGVTDVSKKDYFKFTSMDLDDREYKHYYGEVIKNPGKDALRTFKVRGDIEKGYLFFKGAAKVKFEFTSGSGGYTKFDRDTNSNLNQFVFDSGVLYYTESRTNNLTDYKLCGIFTNLTANQGDTLNIKEGVTKAINTSSSHLNSITKTLTLPSTLTKIESGNFDFFTRLETANLANLATLDSSTFLGTEVRDKDHVGEKIKININSTNTNLVYDDTNYVFKNSLGHVILILNLRGDNEEYTIDVKRGQDSNAANHPYGGGSTKPYADKPIVLISGGRDKLVLNLKGHTWIDGHLKVGDLTIKSTGDKYDLFTRYGFVNIENNMTIQDSVGTVWFNEFHIGTNYKEGKGVRPYLEIPEDYTDFNLSHPGYLNENSFYSDVKFTTDNLATSTTQLTFPGVNFDQGLSITKKGNISVGFTAGTKPRNTNIMPELKLISNEGKVSITDSYFKAGIYKVTLEGNKGTTIVLPSHLELHKIKYGLTANTSFVMSVGSETNKGRVSIVNYGKGINNKWDASNVINASDGLYQKDGVEYALYQEAGVKKAAIVDFTKDVANILNIPETVKTDYKVVKVANYAFERNDKIEVVNFPDTMEEYGEGLFYLATALRRVKFTDTLKIIDEEMFKETYQLEELVVPKSVKKLELSNLIGKPHYNLRKITIKSLDITNYRTETDVLIDPSNDTLLLGNTTGRLAPTIRIIGTSAFEGVKFINGVTVTIKKWIKEIGKAAFKGSTLKTIIIEEGVERIEAEAFANITTLTTIVIPKSVKYIGENAFSGSPNVKITVGVTQTFADHNYSPTWNNLNPKTKLPTTYGS